MEHIRKFLKLVFILVFMVSVFSCKNNKAEKVEEPTKMDETASTSVIPVFSPFDVIVIKHKVANYDKWLIAYNAHDSIRHSYGITHVVIGRGMDDKNMIMVIDKMDDRKKAMEFSRLPSLKDAMKKAGVMGVPTFSFYNVVRNDDSKINIKDRLMVTHKVKDFDAWLKVYDAEGTTKRMEEGFVDRGIARSVDDPNKVTLVFAISDMKKARAAIASEAKKKIMMEAGVVGAPELFYYQLEDK